MALGRLLGRQFHHRSDAAVGSEGEPRMHYTLGVLLPLEPAATREAVEAALDALMAPYWQDMQVEPYTVRCECVGRTAEDEVDAQVESEFGWVASLPERFETDPAFARYRTGEMEASIEADKVWEAFIRLDERRARRRELLEAHPKKDAPSTLEDGRPCVICNMTGKDEWTANPDMKWDWWKIDGRWMRELRGNSTAADDSEKDTPCPYCKGTGKRFTTGCLPPKSIEARRSLAASERSAAPAAAPARIRLRPKPRWRGRSFRSVTWPKTSRPIRLRRS